MANLVDHKQFAKLKPSKLVVTINNLLTNLFLPNLIFLQNLHPSKLSHYTVVAHSVSQWYSHGQVGQYYDIPYHDINVAQ